MLYRLRPWLLWLALFFAGFSATACAEQIPIFDAHNQSFDGVTAEEVISLMNAAGVQRTFFASEFPWHDSSVLKAAEKYPKRILPLLRTKGGREFEANDANLRELLGSADKDPRYFGMAELLIYHASKPNINMPLERKLSLSDEKVKWVVAFTEKKQWPIILHIEMAAVWDLRQSYMTQLEQFLSDHPNLPVMMIHMAQLDSREVERLIQAHPNIYFMTSTVKFLSSDPAKSIHTQGGFPWTPMFKDGELMDQWRYLFIRYPDRFVYATDNTLLSIWRKSYVEVMQIWQHAFQTLPPEVAHKIAHQNAERLWHLPPSD
ncbi:MAG: amidohydrolase family protein [Negativicutes bacterium]|nr:amidohydrolase family protein [Negativicutes bacterium]MDR3592824.1 amidohydrolase family protein [Negativicutes bacterium]